MTNRIAELRALRKLERVVHDGGELLSWANAADTLRGALYDDCDALLDCAEALHEGRRAIGEHHAPDDCYATGPMTGDPIRDLVQCPACSFIAMYDTAVAKLNGDDHD